MQGQNECIFKGNGFQGKLQLDRERRVKNLESRMLEGAHVNKGTFRFSASVVNCYTEGGAHIIGVGDDPATPEKFIILSRFDDGDVDESIGFSSTLTDREVSNCIKAVSVSSREITVSIKESRSEDVGASIFVTDLTSSQFDFDSLTDFIGKIFAGSSSEVSITR
jgi:hypothetical protein